MLVSYTCMMYLTSYLHNIHYKYAMQNNSNKQMNVLTVAIVISTVAVLVPSAAAAAASLVLEQHLALAVNNVGETCIGGAGIDGTPGTASGPGTPGTAGSPGNGTAGSPGTC